jgi:1-deoxy-D-xylulose-5-phosphate reductoisomerase
VCEAAERPAEFVMSAIVGAAGLPPTLAAVRRGACIGLANKETLVCAGALMKREIEAAGATLLPVDSEHNAIFQVIDRDRPEGIERIVLTASGGPFRTWELGAMARATPAQAVAHPNWDMGAKISVDSATMMNKGLEVIEAAYLFDQPIEKIDVLVHPQSVIHSMVAYIDGSVLAQLGAPDMRTPIAYALAWPARMSAPVERLDLGKIAQLTFESPDELRFPALRLAREALRAGAGAPSVLNAANEIAVAAFLRSRLGFLGIAEVVEATLERLAGRQIPDLDAVFALDAEARALAREALARQAVPA